MDNSTFNFNAMEKEQEAETNLELYRFIFLRYLEAVSNLIELRTEAEYIDCIERTIAEGWSFTDPDFMQKEDQAVLGGKILYYRYGMDYSQKGIENAIIQFRADLTAAEMQEKVLWELLLTTVQRADSSCSHPEWGVVWHDEDAAAQHHLIIDDGLSLERVSHYTAELQKLNKMPLPPYSQEASFKLHSYGLSTVAPFSLR